MRQITAFFQTSNMPTEIPGSNLADYQPIRSVCNMLTNREANFGDESQTKLTNREPNHYQNLITVRQNLEASEEMKPEDEERPFHR